MRQFWLRFVIASLVSAVVLLASYLFDVIPLYGIADWLGALLLVLCWLAPLVWVFFHDVTQPGGFRKLTLARLVSVSLAFVFVTVILAPTIFLVLGAMYLIASRALTGA